MFEKIIGNYCTAALPEIERWIEDGALEGTTQTICDVRRLVEANYGVGVFSNEDIIDGIIQAGGIFTNRLTSDTGDYCFVNTDTLIVNLRGRMESLQVMN